ncbi:MAG: 3'-5' exonuclease [Pseudomonadota bacterium]
MAEIGRLLAAGRRPGDIAVFYRTHAASRPLEQALGQARIPCVVVGGRRFYERREVRDVLGWLRLIVNPADGMAFLRVVNVPPRGIGGVTQEGVRNHAEAEGVPVIEGARRYARGARGAGARAVAGFVDLYDRLVDEARGLPPHELVLRVADTTGLLAALRAEDTEEAQGRIENIEALARAARTTLEGMPPDAEPGELLRAFLEQATLASADQDLPDHDGQVTLMTVHLAKGLEFPVVFVVGLVEKGFPHARASERIEDIEEERRLAYVAFTRARERLVLCRPLRRWVRGESSRPGGGGFCESAPSPFLRELPSERTELLGRERFGEPRRPPAPIPAASTRKLEALLSQVRAHGAPQNQAGKPYTGRTLVPEDPGVFAPGVKVRHPAFGDGVVRAIEGSGPGARLLVHFHRLGPKRLRVREARLEVLLD